MTKTARHKNYTCLDCGITEQKRSGSQQYCTACGIKRGNTLRRVKAQTERASSTNTCLCGKDINARSIMCRTCANKHKKETENMLFPHFVEFQSAKRRMSLGMETEKDLAVIDEYDAWFADKRRAKQAQKIDSILSSLGIASLNYIKSAVHDLRAYPSRKLCI